VPEIKINNHIIGGGHPVFIIAELSANHEQNFKLAVKTIHAMKEAGADAVKLQTFTPDSMTLDSDLPWFQTREDSIWAGQKLYDLYKKAYTPWDWHEKLQKIATNIGLEFFSTPFDIQAVNQLESIQVPAFKIASFEITDIPLIKKVASTGKPVIISTGIAEEEDIYLAIETCKQAGNNQIALLKCTSAYPSPFDEANLRAIPVLREKFDAIIGISDHTLGITVPIGAVALGARIIEKHFVLNRKGKGLDREFSLEPNEFKLMVRSVRELEKALGEPTLTLSEKMMQGKKSGRSLFAVHDILKGESLTIENIRSLRPNLGLHPKHLNAVLNKKASKNIAAGTPLDWNLIDLNS